MCLDAQIMDGASARWRALGLLSLAELLALSLWFSASAVLPALSREWALGDGGRAGLTIAVQAGFIVGTLAAALTNLPDLVPARALMMWGALAGALTNAVLALWVEHLTPALVLRFLTGVCLAGTYPPAMKIAATWFREGRGLAIGLLVAALTVGSAAPHLIRGLTDLPWRHTLLAASVAAALGALAVTLVTEGPHRFPPARFDLRMATAVLRERGPRLACFGYFGHMWELYAMWAWLAAFLAASLEARGGGSYAGLNASAATFVCAGLAGGLGAWAGGALADRWGRTTLTMAAMALSGLCAVLIGLTFGGPPLADLAGGGGLGRHRDRGFGPVLHRGDRAGAGGLRRHRAHHSDLPGLRADHGLHLADPAGGRLGRLALGVRHAGGGAGPGGARHGAGCGPCPRPGSWRAAGAESVRIPGSLGRSDIMGQEAINHEDDQGARARDGGDPGPGADRDAGARGGGERAVGDRFADPPRLGGRDQARGQAGDPGLRLQRLRPAGHRRPPAGGDARRLRRGDRPDDRLRGGAPSSSTTGSTSRCRSRRPARPTG